MRGMLILKRIRFLLLTLLLMVGINGGIGTLSRTDLTAYSLGNKVDLASTRTIHFAGLDWVVKSGYGDPGQNHWSDSIDSVWVDTQGRLHLRIRKIGRTWYSAEVYSLAPTSYGTHRFYVISPLDSLNENVVLGMFLYRSRYKEIDIEFSKWGNPSKYYNGQYVVQPGDIAGNVNRFHVTLNGTYTTHYIRWYPTYIQFRSIHGHYPEPPSSDFLINEWVYTGNYIPNAGDGLRIHINLWLVNGSPPSDGQEVEVIIADGDFPQPPPPEAFSKVSPPDGSTNVSTGPTLQWTTSSGATEYFYCVDGINNGICDGTWHSAGSATSVTLPRTFLSPGDTFYWQVKAVNSAGSTFANSGIWWRFTTARPTPTPTPTPRRLPGAFSKVSPPDGSTNVSTGPTLQWTTSSGATEYFYCVDGINNGICDGTWHSAGSATSVTLPRTFLSPGDTFYWQVKAVNSAGSTFANSGIWWRFTTARPTPTPTPTPGTTQQDIWLNQGWDLFSIRVQPPSRDARTVLSSIAGQYDMVIGEDGFYVPYLPEIYDTLQQIDPGRAYWIHVTAPSGTMLRVSGQSLPPTTPLYLTRGWRWVGYLPDRTLPITVAMQSIAGKYDKVIGDRGIFVPGLDPTYWTLTDMRPGEGYLIRMTQDGVLRYPSVLARYREFSAQTSAAGTVSARCAHVKRTPYMTLVYGRVEIDGRPAPRGTLVEAVTSRGTVAACFEVVHPGYLGAIPVYGQVEDGGNGFHRGDVIRWRVNGLEVNSEPVLTWDDDKELHRLDLAVGTSHPRRISLPFVSR